MSKTDANKQDDTNVLRAQDIVPPYNKEYHHKQKVNEIPKFDLAEQIMAEQRKITAVRRKAPGKKTKTSEQRPRIQSTGYAVKQPPPTLSEHERIIAEIVARDIEKLYRGDTSSFHD